MAEASAPSASRSSRPHDSCMSTGCGPGGGAHVGVRTWGASEWEPTENGRCASPLVSPPCRPRLIGRDPYRMRTAHTPRMRRGFFFLPLPLAAVVASGQGREGFWLHGRPAGTGKGTSIPLGQAQGGRLARRHLGVAVISPLRVVGSALPSQSRPAFRWFWSTLHGPPGGGTPGTPDDQPPLGRSRQSAGLRFGCQPKPGDKKDRKADDRRGGGGIPRHVKDWRRYRLPRYLCEPGHYPVWPARLHPVPPLPSSR